MSPTPVAFRHSQFDKPAANKPAARKNCIHSNYYVLLSPRFRTWPHAPRPKAERLSHDFDARLLRFRRALRWPECREYHRSAAPLASVTSASVLIGLD